MTPPGLVSVNGVDLRTHGFRTLRVEGHLTPAATRAPTMAVGGPAGERASGAAATLAPRTVTVTGTLLVRGAAPGLPLATARDAAVQALFAACAGVADIADLRPTGAETRVLTLAIATVPNRVWYGALDAQSTASATGVQGRSGAAALALVFVCPDPRSFDAAPTEVALSAVAADVLVGTAVHGAVITLDGPFAARTLTYTDGFGVVRGTLTVTGAVGAGESVELDLEAETIVHVAVGGARTPRAAWRTAGDWFRLAPADVNGATAPTLVLDAGTGTASVRRAYR